MSGERFPVAGILAAAISTTPTEVAAAFNSAGNLALATDPYSGADGVLAGYETTNGRAASLQPAGRVVQAVAGATLTAGTHRHLMVGANGRLYPLTAGGRIFANWCPRANEFGVSLNAAAGDVIDVFLVPDVPRPWIGTATIALGDSTVTVNVNAAFNGRTVLVTPHAGFDDTATAFRGVVAAGVLTITANDAATAATGVAYMIDGGN